jgi:hypothetical protein
LNTWQTTSQPVTVGFDGAAIGATAWMLLGNQSAVTFGTTVSGMAETTVSIQPDGGVDWGQVIAAEAAITVLKFAVEQYAPAAPIPAAIKPVVEAITNYSFFTGRALETPGDLQKDPSERYRTGPTGSSELAKAISKAAEDLAVEYPALKGAVISPIKIDNFLRGYFGTVAGQTTMLMDGLMNPDRRDRPIHTYPFLSVFMYDKDVLTGPRDEFYELRNKVAPKLATLAELKERNPTRAIEYMETHKQDLIMAQMVQSAFAGMADLRKHREWVESAAGAAAMTEEARKEAIKELNKQERDYLGWVRERKAEMR